MRKSFSAVFAISAIALFFTSCRSQSGKKLETSAFSTEVVVIKKTETLRGQVMSEWFARGLVYDAVAKSGDTRGDHYRKN